MCCVLTVCNCPKIDRKLFGYSTVVSTIFWLSWAGNWPLLWNAIIHVNAIINSYVTLSAKIDHLVLIVIIQYGTKTARKYLTVDFEIIVYTEYTTPLHFLASLQELKFRRELRSAL